MKPAIKNSLIDIYSNRFLKYAKVNPKKALFIITSVHNDNCDVLMQYLHRNVSDIKIKVIVDAIIYNSWKDKLAGTGVEVLSAMRNTLRTNYELITSKYVFFMHRRPFKIVHKRKSQVVVNLWHGSGYKDVASNEGEWTDGVDFDYVLVPGPVFVETKSKFFCCRRERVLPIGYPRYDLIGTHSEKADSLKAQLCPNGEKLLIWLPTYRKLDQKGSGSAEAGIHYSYDIPLLKNEGELRRINEKCRDKGIVLLVKRHPYQAAYACEGNSYSNVVFMSNKQLDENGVALYELLGLTDGMISDYSSAAIDYLLLDKPMAFCLDDFEQYKEARGFVFENPLDYMPGHYLYDVSDFEKYIDDVAAGNDLFRAKRYSLLPQVHNPCDNYCKRIWEKISSEVQNPKK